MLKKDLIQLKGTKKVQPARYYPDYVCVYRLHKIGKDYRVLGFENGQNIITSFDIKGGGLL
jgi:hypothetical protein